MRRQSRVVGLLFVCLLPPATSLALQDPSAVGLLEGFRHARAKLKNYQCSAEYASFRSYEARKRLFDWSLESGDLSAETIAELRKNLTGTGRTFERQTVVGDSRGRMKLTHAYGQYGPDNSKEEASERMAVAWDGTGSVTYTRLTPDNPGGAMIASTRPPHFKFAAHPLWSFGGRFVSVLERAIETGSDIDTHQKTPDGPWEIAFTCDDPVTGASALIWTGTVDPAQGFSVTRWDYTRPDGARYQFSATFKEVAPGVWFPTEGQMLGHFADGMRDALKSVTVRDVIVNDPNFSNALFHIEIPNGTIVQDAVAGIIFIAGDPSSLRVSGSMANTGYIVTEAMKPEAGGRKDTIFLPHIRKALETNRSFVLDLGTSTLIGVDKADGVQDTLTRLRGGGMGDIFWSNGFVVVEGIRIAPKEGEPREWFTFVKMDHGGIYKFTAPPPLPCVLSITGRDDRRYRVTIQSIEEDGVSLLCEPRTTGP